MKILSVEEDAFQLLFIVLKINKLTIIEGCVLCAQSFLYENYTKDLNKSMKGYIHLWKWSMSYSCILTEGE